MLCVQDALLNIKDNSLKLITACHTATQRMLPKVQENQWGITLQIWEKLIPGMQSNNKKKENSNSKRHRKEVQGDNNKLLIF